MKENRRLYIAVYFFVFCMSSCSGNNTEDDAAEKAYIAAIDAYTRQEYKNALKEARKAISKGRNFYQARFLEGKILFFDGQEAAAEKIFDKLVSKYPAYTEARIWHIRCLILSGEYKKAAAELEKELSFNNTDWRIYYLYALLGDKTDNYEQRLAMNRKAETVLTDSAKVYMDLALTWYVLGMNGRANEYMQKASVISGANVSMEQIQNAIKQTILE